MPADKRRWWERLEAIQRLQYLWRRFVKLRMTPDQIARGLAIGVFFGFAPVLGLQIAAAVFFAALLKGSKIAAAIATWISNPLTYAPMWWLDWKVGTWVLGYAPQQPAEMAPFLELLKSKMSHIALPMLIGWLVCGVVAALLTYLIGRRSILYIQFQRLQRVDGSAAADSALEENEDDKWDRLE